MQYSIVNYKKVKENLDFRIDAEYYRQYFLDLENKIILKNNKLVKDIATNKTEKFKRDKNFEYLEISNIDTSDASCIYQFFKRHDAPSRAQKILKNKDVVISTVRPNRNAVAIIDSIEGLKIGSSGLCVLRNFKEVLPEYIFVLFKTKFFRDLLDRETKATMYPAVAEDDILKLKVPIFSSDFQNIISMMTKELFNLKSKSKKLYKQAEELLLSELGLADCLPAEASAWVGKPKNRLAFVKNFSEVEKAGRVDAEYFQPKYEEIIEAIKKYGNGSASAKATAGKFNELGNLAEVKKSIEPGRGVYQEEGIPFVRVSNLSKFEIKQNNQQYLKREFYKKFIDNQPKRGEILLSKDATPGIAYHLNEEPKKMIVSGGILRLKTKDENLLPEYLTLVLNSEVVQSQIIRDAGGSIINHWRPDQVKKTIIPIPEKEKQREIKNLIKKSFKNRKQSKELLEIAKRGVEMAIEKDEQEAEKWINEKLEKIGIIL